MGILLGPTDLDGFRMLIKSLTSMEVTGVRKRELQVLLDRYSRGDLGVFGIVFVMSSAIFTKKSLKIFEILLGSDVTFPSGSLILLIEER